MTQPIHVVYGGAHLFGPDTVAKVGGLARKSFTSHAPDSATLAAAIGIASSIAPDVHARVAARLATLPVADYRIDFEDGYGIRADVEEDAHADAVGALLASSAEAVTSGARVGVRVKSFAPATRARALRTLTRVLEPAARSHRLPERFVVTLPKVSTPDEVSAFVGVLAAHEAAIFGSDRRIGVELMVETPQALIDREGRVTVRSLALAADGRCESMHLGSYDLTASLGVPANAQRLQHPLCDFAKATMQIALADTGVAISDGATVVLPTEPHRGPNLAPAELAANRKAVHEAWRLHADGVRHGLAQGIYQGWDLHPAQIPARLAAVFGFFADALPNMTDRLGSFLARAAQASRVGQAFDDAATGRGLLGFFDRGIDCGAIDEAVLAPLGIGLPELRARTFDFVTKS